MYANYWNQFLPELQILGKILSTPYSWNREEQKFSLIHRHAYVKRFRALSIIFALHMPFICWNLLQTLRHETNILLMIFALGYFSTTFVITLIRWMYQDRDTSGNIVKLLNATVDFQKRSTRTGKTDIYRII
jgi:hypothetical protein